MKINDSYLNTGVTNWYVIVEVGNKIKKFGRKTN